MTEEECPFCGGKTEVDSEDLVIEGLNYGEFEVVKCLECGETIYPAEVWDIVQEVLTPPVIARESTKVSDVVVWDPRDESFSWPSLDGSVTASLEPRIPVEITQQGGEPSITAA